MRETIQDVKEGRTIENHKGKGMVTKVTKRTITVMYENGTEIIIYGSNPLNTRQEAREEAIKQCNRIYNETTKNTIR
jgi:hypothetical protein